MHLGDDSVTNKNLAKGKKVIGKGAKRIIYDRGNGYVLKVPKSKKGFISNKREVSMYRSCPLNLKKHLGKIKDFGKEYRWVIMEKYTRGFPKSIRYARKLKELKRLFIKGGIFPWDIESRYGKPNYKNLRLKKNGEIVVIDYGNFSFLRKK